MEWKKILLVSTALSILYSCNVIDSFKNINDLYGHLVGDRPLIEIAECLASCTRNALLARFKWYKAYGLRYKVF